MPAKRVNADLENRTDALHEAEMKHQRATIETAIIVKDEEVRRARTRSAMLRGDVDTIRAQLAQQNERYEKLSKQHSEVRAKLVAATKRWDEQENKSKAQTREIANLQTELQSLNGISQDSTRILSEKLALTRELANLKPELEHLRSQLANHSDVLAEKLALERQVNTLEVELANEKRAAQRAIERQESRGSEVEEDLRQQIADLEKKLAAEKRTAQRAKQDAEKESNSEDSLRQQVEELEAQLVARQADSAKSRRELERQLAEVQSQNEIFSERFTEMKAKLKETRQELKTCRAELLEAKQLAALCAVQEPTAAKTKAKAQVGRKRRVNQITEGLDILATPTEEKRVKQPLKKRVEALAGEKSTFSITPFLSKTITLGESAVAPQADANATLEDDDEDDVMDDTFAGHHPTEDVPAEDHAAEGAIPEPAVAKETKDTGGPATKQPKPRGRPKKVALRKSPSAKQNISLTNMRKVLRTENTLEKVMEEEGEEEDQENRTSAVPVPAKKALKKTKAVAKSAAEDPAQGSAAAAPAAVPAPAAEETKKKKRKLLGGASKTLFEDDDEGAADAAPVAKKQGKVTLGGAGAMRGLAKTQVAAVAARGAFAGKTFSPLKRDRRGVNASFLA